MYDIYFLLFIEILANESLEIKILKKTNFFSNIMDKICLHQIK